MTEPYALTEYSPYLDEVRKRIYSFVLVFIMIFAAGFLGAGKLIEVMIRTFKLSNVTIATSSPFQYVELATSIGIFLAIVIAAPLAIYHSYAFLRPALTSSEKWLFFKLLPMAFLLFTLGFAYGAVTISIAFQAMAALNTSIGVSNIWTIDKFFSQIVVTSALLGILFQFPLILTYLIRIGLMNTSFLRKKRRHAVVMIFAFVALLPPTDGISLLMTALPLVAIYELTIFANRSQIRPA